MTNEKISTEDRGFLYGDGLFETVRVEEGRPRFLERHRRRFVRSAKELGFPQTSIEEGERSLESLQARPDGLWRITVTRKGEGVFGGGTGTVALRHRPLPTPSELEGASITVVEGCYFPGDRLARYKTTSWIRSVHARRVATARGFDEALMVSAEGRVGEASAANVFLRISGEWVTPVVEGILPGVLRSFVLDRAMKSGLEIEERSVLTADLQTCEAMALTSTGRLVTAVAEVDGVELDVELVEELRDLVTVET